MKRFLLPLFFLTAGIMLAGCAGSGYGRTNKQYKKRVKEYAKLLREYPVTDSMGLKEPDYWVGTTNFSMRRPNFVIIHHTAQNSCDQTLKTFTLPRTQVSAHYVICKDGTVHHMLNDLLRAHHAGLSKWGNTTDLNSSSIGIEIDNNGKDTFSVDQLSSLYQLLGRLKRAYQIPAANFIGHSDIAPGRKVDPNRHFPWQALAGQGYGLWYDTVGIKVPPDFNPLQSLRLIGYNIKQPDAAIGSFKLHFVPSDSSLVITEDDKKIMLSLQQLYQ